MIQVCGRIYSLVFSAEFLLSLLAVRAELHSAGRGQLHSLSNTPHNPQARGAITDPVVKNLFLFFSGAFSTSKSMCDLIRFT